MKFLYNHVALIEETFDYSRYLEYPATEDERLYLSNSHVFDLFKIALWKETCVELAKIFKPKIEGNININKTIPPKKSNNELKDFTTLIFQMKSGDFGENAKMTEKIQEWEITFAEYKGQIQLLKYYRDKVYAHTDLNRKHSEEIEIQYQDVNSLIVFAKSIIDFLSNEVLEWPINIEVPKFNPEKFDIIKKLINYEKFSSLSHPTTNLQ
ncbi:hypothetical protein [Mucilaginibacter sp. AK015]|uniref:AbiU2 domain-containing protein n=1 Tax=Mucilaginibacter sp. AK015 TaxID=2723072 RepID=UPI00161190B6|nr:hypothetical protein [Mucilaginibacter sp. AK015]MBB5397309.1 hypothetical protein [Mucilaginibacter sp. AK015]